MKNCGNCEQIRPNKHECKWFEFDPVNPCALWSAADPANQCPSCGQQILWQHFCTFNVKTSEDEWHRCNNQSNKSTQLVIRASLLKAWREHPTHGFCLCPHCDCAIT